MRCRRHESSPARNGCRGARLGPTVHPVGAVDLNTLNEVTSVRLGDGEEGARGTDGESSFEAPVHEGTADYSPQQRRRPSQLHLSCCASTPHRSLGSGTDSMRRGGESTVRDQMSAGSRRRHLLPIPPSGWRAPWGTVRRASCPGWGKNSATEGPISDIKTSALTYPVDPAGPAAAEPASPAQGLRRRSPAC